MPASIFGDILAWNAPQRRLRSRSRKARRNRSSRRCRWAIMRRLDPKAASDDGHKYDRRRTFADLHIMNSVGESRTRLTNPAVGSVRRTTAVHQWALCLLTVTAVVMWHGTSQSQSRGAPSQFVGATIEGVVSSIVDGDTFDMVPNDSKRTIRIRVFGIDAPERGEAFSSVAMRHARVLLLDQRVRVTGRDVDMYHRLVATIVAGGQDIGAAMLSAGLACHFTRYSNDASLAAAEAAARKSGVGFWAPGASKPACTGQRRSVAGPFHGNRQSHVYHAPTCPNYMCRNCTQVFQTEAAAREAGFRPAGDCLR